MRGVRIGFARTAMVSSLIPESSGMRRALACILTIVTACSQAPRVVPEQAPVETTGQISAGELRGSLTAFAADSMRGRRTGTADATRAAEYLVSRIQRIGLEPAGDSMYVQRVPLQREEFTASSRVVVTSSGHTSQLELGRDIVPILNLGPGVPPTRRDVEGDLVFLGYGVTMSKPARDDFAGQAIEGKVVVVVNGAPAGVDSAARERLEAQTAVSERLARILPLRPAAVVVLLTGKAAAEFQQGIPELMHSVTMRTGGEDVPESERVLPMIMLGSVRAGSPLLPATWPADDRAQSLSRHLSAHVRQSREAFTALNVVGVVRGSDPTLARTYVAVGAHYDHIGVVPPVNGDSIANGADDDGSGSVSLLAIARSLNQAEVRPKRSTLFVWHVGEENGLLGSAWFVDHATVPIDSIVAQINVDMIGRNAASLLYLIGPNAAPGGQSKRLGAIVDSVNAVQRMPFAINRDWDSATHPEHLYERSDHYNYARKGIPIVFFTTGLHEDYHKPSDEVSKIDFEKMSRVAQLIRDVVVAVGNGAKRPR